MKIAKDFFEEEPILSSSIRVTSECNLACEYCYSNSGEKSENELGTDELKNLINKLSEMGLFRIFFTGGEPFLRDDLKELLKCATDNKLEIFLSTNGNIEKEKIEGLDKYNISVFQVSIDGLEKTHNEIKGSNESFKRALDTLQFATENLKTDIAVATTLSKKNKDEITDLIKKLNKECEIDIFSLITMFYSGRAETMDRMSRTEELQKINEISDFYEENRFNFELSVMVPPGIVPKQLKGEKYGEGFLCTFPRMLAFKSNGDVAPCDGFFGQKEMILGNVREQSLEEIWNSEKMKKLRNVGPEDLKGVCSKCKYKEFCVGGCRAMAYIKYKDIKAPDPVCQEAYDSKEFGDEINE